MNEISNQLQAAVIDAPPTRIDVDHLIRSELRRRRHRSWVLSATGAAAAVAAVAITTPTLFAGAPGPLAAPAVGPTTAVAPSTGVRLCTGVTPKPSGPQTPLETYDTVRPRPTEDPAAAVARLTGAFRDGLRRWLPAGVRAESLQPGCAKPQFQYHPRYQEYDVGAALRRGKERGLFSLNVRPSAQDGTLPDCSRWMKPGDCEIVHYQDGSVAAQSRMDAGPGQVQLSLWLARPDGTTVWVITNNFRNEVVGGQMVSTKTADAPLLTMNQLAAAALSPGLTLYP
ncbi:hypothetical protein ACGFI9_21135 [Micromonospora sp. NPDC048930]|uniref:hypothetical protein n=1 Tax=Micromonospora sp. NPDC048930 TaxID=3364261 RepID=UPI003723B530